MGDMILNMPWLYKSLDAYAYPPTYECPLCKAVVTEIYEHTEYHKQRGEEDE
jgi:hypothetical protein